MKYDSYIMDHCPLKLTPVQLATYWLELSERDAAMASLAPVEPTAMHTPECELTTYSPLAYARLKGDCFKSW